MRFRWFASVAALGAIQACAAPSQTYVDEEVRAMGVYAIATAPTNLVIDPLPTGAAQRVENTPSESGLKPTDSARAILPVVYQSEAPAMLGGPRRLSIPKELPGADAEVLRLPEDPVKRRQAVKEMYPPMLSLQSEAAPSPGPYGRPLALADLQTLGESYSPEVKNAYAAVEAAKGGAFQAGAYPNPTFAFEHDTVQTGAAGYPGFYIDQVIKTAGKVKLQKASAIMDLLNAKVALKRARSDVRYAIRSNYFAVLVAKENVRVSEALYNFTEEVYRVQVELLDGGFAAAYEPMQLRPLVRQAELSVVQARNQEIAAWRQLTAAIGLPDMPRTELEGRIDLPVPVYDYEKLAARLEMHTDVQTAYNNLQQSRYRYTLAEAAPIPDVDVRLLVQKDYTSAPFQISHSFQAVFTAPIWDQNKGGILQAKWNLSQAAVGPELSRNALILTLADAFNRYETGRAQVEITAAQVRDQVRVYRGLYERRQQVPGDVSFGDIVNAQQLIATYISGYITALGLQWQAVVDVANIRQTENLFLGDDRYEVAPIPNLSLLPRPLIKAPSCGDGQPKAASPVVDAATVSGANKTMNVEWIAAKAGGPNGVGSPKTAMKSRSE